MSIVRIPVIYLAAFTILTCRPALAAGPIRIVDNGTPLATIVVPDSCDAQTKAVADMLVRYVKESSGAELPVFAEDDSETAGQPITIHVGLDTYATGLNLELDKLDDDGFVIRGLDDNHLVIAGSTPHGTEFGVCEFLERYLGVRWLMPGTAGTDVPEHKTIEIPLENVRQEPVFFSRLFSGLSGAHSTWAQRNRMHGRVQFHHNLQRLIAPEKYAETHPEFFPIRNGKRYIPPNSNTHGWQPCFSAPGLAEEAAKTIIAFFDEHPEAESYSLGVVDSSGHCECEKCQAQDTGELNFIGRRDCSDRYYGWCNQVVERVLQKHPDKWFGCLAYSEVAQAPSRVQVNPRIIPYMTYDRMKWIDAELEADGKRMTEVWQAASPVLGWYDYIYGSAYCVPRVWFHKMADYYRYAQAHGVRALYAEAYPNWGEGPKLYVSLKLQWDPNRDVDELLREWYVRTVGPDAAGDLAAYYALWEDFWTRRILDSKWFSKGGQYLAFNNPGYLADVTQEDIAKSRKLLESVLAKTKTPKQRARAELLMLAFAYYEASALAFAGDRRAEDLAVASEADALNVLDEAGRCLEMARKRQRLVAEVFPKHRELMHLIDFNRYPLLRGDAWGAGLIWTVFDWADRSRPVRERLRQLADSPGAASLSAKTMLMTLEAPADSLVNSPSFDDAEGKWPAGWSPWVKWGVGSMAISPKAARTGKYGVLCKGMKRGGPLQTVAFSPDCYAALASIRVPQAPQGNATITLSITPLDEQNANLPAVSTMVRAKAGDWTRVAAAGEIPAEIDGKRVKSLRLIVVVDGFEPDEEIHIDDLTMFKIVK
ncbi:MAG: DUF4838 domain-containing protein [Planctomycetaceae bacterium]|nr:DUF4838 domain-containing protein [Planctomycetaceae bacterium]